MTDKENLGKAGRFYSLTDKGKDAFDKMNEVSFNRAIVERVREEKRLIEEDLKTQVLAIDQARKEYQSDRTWFGNDADRGYLDSLLDGRSASQLVLRTLNRLLGITEEKQL